MATYESSDAQAELFGSPNLKNVPYKDDDVSMAYPIFALSATTETRTIQASHGKTINIIPSGVGAATMRDKDLLIYVSSQIIERLNSIKDEILKEPNGSLFTEKEITRKKLEILRRDHSIARTFTVDAHRFLHATKRGTGRKSYENIVGMLNRLQGTLIQTDIPRGGEEFLESFNLIERFKVVSAKTRSITVKDGKGQNRAHEKEIARPIQFTVTISEWFFAGLINFEVLTLDDKYFDLSKDMDRRIYEVARKHCGNQTYWKINIDSMAEKVGASSYTRSRFRNEILRVIHENQLPNYCVALDRNKTLDDVVFYTRDTAKMSKELITCNKSAQLIPWYESLIRSDNIEQRVPKYSKEKTPKEGVSASEETQ